MAKEIEGLDLKLAKKWRPVFLEHFASTGNVRLSSKVADVDHRTVYKHKRLDPDFAQEWALAREMAIGELEGAAWTRGLSVSDTLLIFLLKAHDPARYNTAQRHELMGPGGTSLIPAATSSDDRDKRLAELIAKAVAGKGGGDSGDVEP